MINYKFKFKNKIMKLDLNKKELISLIKGAGNGSYQLAQFLEDRKLGKLYGFPSENFQWNDEELNKLTEQGLYTLYVGMTNWKDQPTEPTSKLSKERVEELQRMYYQRTGIWLPVKQN